MTNNSIEAQADPSLFAYDNLLVRQWAVDRALTQTSSASASVVISFAQKLVSFVQDAKVPETNA